MALFSRKNRPNDDDTVRLTSADHSWWNNRSLLGDDDLDDEVVDAELLEPGGWDGDGSSDLADLADALEGLGYGDAMDLLSLPAPGAPPAGSDPDGNDVHGPDRDWTGEPAPGAEHVDEAALFARDGLPPEDRLVELLGTLGLEGDADWVDIARAHRRLAPPAGPGRAELENEAQRRAANEAYACLRLFHH
jgi:hypothetical protein